MTGAAKPAKKAKSLGLVDQTVKPLGPGKVNNIQYLEQVAVGVAKQVASGSLKHKQKKDKMPNKVSFFFKILIIKDHNRLTKQSILDFGTFSVSLKHTPAADFICILSGLLRISCAISTQTRKICPEAQTRPFRL